MKFKQLSIVLLIGLTACQQTSSDKEYVIQHGDTFRIVKEYDQKGNLKTESMFDKDSLRQGIAKMFYEDGTLYAEIDFKDGQKHGVEKSYYKSGQLKHVGLNLLGKEDSTWVWYYKDGAIKQLDNWINGATHGENKTYYKDGKLQVFDFYNIGGLIYTRSYDTTGTVTNEKGEAPVSIVHNRNNFKTGEVLDVVVLVGLQPDWNARISVKDEKGQVIAKANSKNDFEEAIWGHRFVIEKQVSELGVHKWYTQVVVSDEFGKELRCTDTLVYTVVPNG